MKKLIIAAIALIIGLATNAAIVDWKFKITGVSGSSGDAVYSGYTAYLVDKAAWDLAVIAGIQASTFSDKNVVMDLTTFNTGVGMKNNVTYTTVNGAGSAAERAKEISSLNVGSTRDFYYIVLNTNASPNEFQNVATVALTGRLDSGEVDSSGGRASTASAFDGGTWTPVGAGPTPVPEPTTGLLVLAGLAGLALRRRHA